MAKFDSDQSLKLSEARRLFHIMTTEEKPIDLDMLDEVFGKDGREDILSTFITHSDVLLPRIDTAFEEKDVATVIDVAHQIKGMCASVYANKVSRNAHALERLAKEGEPDWNEMSNAFAVLKSDLANLTSFLAAQH